jgi:hypothetical protein
MIFKNKSNETKKSEPKVPIVKSLQYLALHNIDKLLFKLGGDQTLRVEIKKDPELELICSTLEKKLAFYVDFRQIYRLGLCFQNAIKKNKEIKSYYNSESLCQIINQAKTDELLLIIENESNFTKYSKNISEFFKKNLPVKKSKPFKIIRTPTYHDYTPSDPEFIGLERYASGLKALKIRCLEKGLYYDAVLKNLVINVKSFRAHNPNLKIGTWRDTDGYIKVTIISNTRFNIYNLKLVEKYTDKREICFRYVIEGSEVAKSYTDINDANRLAQYIADKSI